MHKLLHLLSDAWCWSYSWARYPIFMALPWNVATNTDTWLGRWLLTGAGIAYVGTWSNYRWLRSERRSPNKEKGEHG